MAHDYLIKDIAFQAGLSAATVDRVINDRGGVRRQTAARVSAAIEELRQQDEASSLAGRTYVFDIVMEAPDRFTRAVRKAFESEVAAFHPAITRARFHLAEQMREQDLLALLARIGRRGSHGVVLKAPDTPGVNAAVQALSSVGIPVITLVTDLPHSPRLAYAGADNRAAGETAAYLIGSHFGNRPGSVLVTLSSNRFRGEEERESGFRRLLRDRYPHLGIVEASEGYGKDSATGSLVRTLLERDPSINAVYSIGGGNRAVVEAFDMAGRKIEIFVAHDLDDDNLDLLRRERVNFVLHHNLAADAASVYRTFLKARHATARIAGPSLSAIEIITPFNRPA